MAITIGDLLVSVRASADAYANDLKAIQRETTALTNGLKPITKAAADIGTAFTSAGKVLTVAFTLPLTAIGALSLKAASDFESSFAEVTKTVNATKPQLAALAQGFRDMAKEMPVTVTELNAIGAAAGQLGIKQENILSFTKTMVELGVASNISGEQGATALARFANVAQVSEADFEELANAIVGLGAQFEASESEVLEFGQRIASTGAQVGLSADQILAFGTALASAGINAEAGGTAISTTLSELAKAAFSGGPKLEEFARIAGDTLPGAASRFAQAFKEDAAGATVKFIEGLGKVTAEGGNVFGVLESIGLSDRRVRDALLSMANAGDTLSTAMKVGAFEFRENGAATAEYKVRLATLESQLAIFKGQLNDVAVTIGTALLPVFKNLLESAKPIIAVIADLALKFSQLPTSVQTTTIAIAAAAAAIGPLLFVTGQMVTSFTSLIPLVIRLSGVFTGAGGLTGAVTAATALLTGPAGLVLAIGASVVALGVLSVEIVKTYRSVKEANENATKSLKGFETGVDRNVKILKDKYGVQLITAGKSTEQLDNETRKLIQAFTLNVDATGKLTRGLTETNTSKEKAKTLTEQLSGAQSVANSVTGDAARNLETQSVAAGKASAAEKILNDELARGNALIPGMMAVPQLLTDAKYGWENNVRIVTQFNEQLTTVLDNNRKFRDDSEVAWSAFRQGVRDASGELANGEIALRDYSALIVPPEVSVRVKDTASTTNKAFSDAFESLRDTGRLVWTDLLEDGKFKFGNLATAVSGIFKTLAADIMANMQARLLTPLTDAIQRQLSSVMGKIPGLGGIFGAPSGGGSTGGGGGGGITGFLSNPWTIGIGAALGAAGLAISRWVGQGRKTADKFVQEFQNPFDAAIIEIHDAFYAAAEAGQLTADEAEEARRQVQALWATFQKEANAFAAQGENEAKVVNQAFARVASVWGADIGLIVNGMAGVVAALRGQEVSQLPQFASGTDYVPHTGLAMVHQGERIIPAGENAPSSSNTMNIYIDKVYGDRKAVTDFCRTLVDEINRNVKYGGGWQLIASEVR